MLAILDLNHPETSIALLISMNWFFGIPLSYLIIGKLLNFFKVLRGMTRCGGYKTDIMAFEIVAGFCVTYISISSAIAFFGGTSGELAADKFYGRSIFVENHLLIPMIFYQGWNIVLCFILDDLRDNFMVCHHLVALMISIFTLYPYLHYYVIIFWMVEVSNIPLTVVDVFKYFPELKKNYEWMNSLARLLFAILFICYRLVMWPIMSVPFWIESFELLKSGKQHSTFAVTFIMLSNIILTYMQFLWGGKIITSLLKMKRRDESKSND